MRKKKEFEVNRLQSLSILKQRCIGSLCLLFFFCIGGLGCSVPHVKIILPSKEASLERRQKAYQTYRPLFIVKSHELSNGETIVIYEKLQLGNGMIVHDPTDLKVAVFADSRTAIAIRNMKSWERSRKLLFGAGVGVGAIGLGAFFYGAFAQRFSNRTLLQESAFWAGGGMFMIGTASVILSGQWLKGEMQRHKRFAFRAFHRDFTKRLGLLKLSKEKRLPPKKKPTTQGTSASSKPM